MWSSPSLLLSWSFCLLEVYLWRAVFILEIKSWVTWPGRATYLHTGGWNFQTVLMYRTGQHNQLLENRGYCCQTGCSGVWAGLWALSYDLMLGLKPQSSSVWVPHLCPFGACGNSGKILLPPLAAY